VKERHAVLLVVVVLSACSGDRPTEPVRVVERDSAGIHIVESAVDTAALRSGWSIATEPSLVLGGMDAEESEQLYNVAGGVRLDDGRFVIVNAGTADVRVFTAQGELQSVFGREGDGPGEYRNPSLAGRGAGDSLVVFDAGLRRVTLITADSGAGRSYDVGSEGGGFPLPLGTFDDGSVAVGGGMAFSSSVGFPSGFIRPTSRHVIIGPDGEIITDFGDLPAAEMFAEVNGSSFRARAIAFGKVTIAEPSGDRLWIGTGERWQLEAFRRDGSLERIVRLDRALAAVTSAVRDRWIEERLEDLTDANEIREQRAQLAELPVPETVAPYQTIAADRLGNLWIGETVLPGEEARTWTILDPDGRAIGRVTMPERTFPVEIGADYMLGITRDEFDVESLTLWPLQRGASAADVATPG
jgi:hypothetical protein